MGNLCFKEEERVQDWNKTSTQQLLEKRKSVIKNVKKMKAILDEQERVREEYLEKKKQREAKFKASQASRQKVYGAIPRRHMRRKTTLRHKSKKTRSQYASKK